MSGPPPPWGGPYGSPAHGSGPPTPFAPPGQPAPGYPPTQPAPGYPSPQPPPVPAGRRRQDRYGAVLPAVIVASIVALVVGGLAGFGGALLSAGLTSGLGSRLAGAPADPSSPMDAVAVADRLLVSTVKIVYDGGTGSGFVLDADGHIVTNNHVIEAAARSGAPMRIEFGDGRRARAAIVGRSPGYDLAVLRVDAPDGSLRPSALGDSARVKPGQAVLAAGAPLGLGGSVTSGIVSAVDRPLGVGEQPTTADSANVAYIDGIQTDAAINPGNSGGPLADANGHVIGVNSAILTLGGSAVAGRGGNIGLGFAIPINQAKVITAEIIRNGHATYPVIEATVGADPDGARLTEVAPGGPAAQAGLAAGDVITQVAGKPISSATDLIVRIRSHRPGDRVSLEVRGRGPVTVALGSKVG